MNISKYQELSAVGSGKTNAPWPRMKIQCSETATPIMLKQFSCNAQTLTIVSGSAHLVSGRDMSNQDKRNRYSSARDEDEIYSPPALQRDQRQARRQVPPSIKHEEECDEEEPIPAVANFTFETGRMGYMSPRSGLTFENLRAGSNDVEEPPSEDIEPAEAALASFGVDSSIQVGESFLDSTSASFHDISHPTEGNYSHGIDRSPSLHLLSNEYGGADNDPNRFPPRPERRASRPSTYSIPPAPPDDAFQGQFFSGHWGNPSYFAYGEFYPPSYPGIGGHHLNMPPAYYPPYAPESTLEADSIADQTSSYEEAGLGVARMLERRSDGHEEEETSSNRNPVPRKKHSSRGLDTKIAAKKKSKPKKRRIQSGRDSSDSASSSTSSPSGCDHSNCKFPGTIPSKEEIDSCVTERARSALMSWHKKLRDLYLFRELHGHTKVPQKYPPNKKLGVWVNKQRMEKKLYDDGKPTSMTKTKIEKLELAGFEWAKPKGVDAWEQKYEELLEYINECGDPHVPTKYKNNRALGRWVSTQRNMYKKFQFEGCFNNLPTAEIQRRIRLLDKVHFSWDMAPAATISHHNSSIESRRRSGQRDHNSSEDDEDYEE